MLQTKCTTSKCVRRNGSFVGSVLVVSVFLFLLAASRLVGSQTNSSAAPAAPHPPSPAASVKADTFPLDGLQLTDDQKTKIAQIRQNVESRREAVLKNDGLTQDRKETIIQRLHRMETSEIFRVLAPEQQRMMDQRHTARQQEQHQSKEAPSTATPPPAAP